MFILTQCNKKSPYHHEHLLLRTDVTWIDESLFSGEVNSLMLAQQGFTMESAGTLTAYKWLLLFWNMRQNMNIIQGTAMECFVTLRTPAQDIRRKSAGSSRDEIFY
jgi:hypothetical protein